MNQPKFKFGTHVRIGSNGFGADFVIDSIQYNHSYKEFEYGDQGRDICALESCLSVYQEPQKKKLYAFRDKEDGEIRFYEEEITRYKSGPRVPEYDIEYPESK